MISYNTEVSHLSDLGKDKPEVFKPYVFSFPLVKRTFPDIFSSPIKYKPNKKIKNEKNKFDYKSQKKIVK